MKIVLLLIAYSLALSQHVSSLVCPTTPVYNAAITTMCVGNDVKVLWPDYENVDQYYRCQGAGNPIPVNCFPTTIFDFSKQKCTKCDDYIPAPSCQALKGKAACTIFTPTKTPRTTPARVPFCSDLADYGTTFVPTCVGNDVYIHWPNYRNVREYYWCQGPYNPQIESCSAGTYFNYYAQTCTDCDSYVAAPECHKLPFDKSNKCQKF